MKCPRCLNEDPSYFFKGSKGWMCRMCISFKRILVEEELLPRKSDEIHEGSEVFSLPFALTEQQEAIALKCAALVFSRDVFIDAVTGAGKGDLVVYAIAAMLEKKKKVGFAIARRQVVLEIYERLKRIFPKAKVIAVCEGYHDEVDGDIIVCTTHQCYRYYQTFDLLILDEVDAFPFKGNEVLQNIVLTSCKGHMVYLTATKDSFVQQRVKASNAAVLNLYVRPHGYPLIVPEVVKGPQVVLWLRLYRWIKGKQNRLVFVPTIKQAEMYAKLCFFVKGKALTSKTKNKDEIIHEFRSGAIDILFATTVLERGVTFEGIDVCVMEADHGVFDEASLIQMAGRVGRSFKCPTGECLFLIKGKSEEVTKCITKIKEANSYAKVSVVS